MHEAHIRQQASRTAYAFAFSMKGFTGAAICRKSLTVSWTNERAFVPRR